MIDIDNYTVVPLFSKVIGNTNLNLTKKEVEKTLNLVKKIKTKKVGDEEHPTSVSTHYDILEDKNFKYLKDKIQACFENFKNKVLKYENTEFKMTGSWLALSKDGEQTKNFHKHTNCFYSGVLYISTPENCGNIEFRNYNDKNFSIENTEPNIFNSENWFFKPKTGLILFFPSETWHAINKNNSNDDRISIAFNFIPVGEIGIGDSLIKL